MSTLSAEQLNRILYAIHPDPFQVLGQHLVTHLGEPYTVVRAFRPEARAVALVRGDTGERLPMTRVADEGFFDAHVLGHTLFPYALELERYDGTVETLEDPYRFGPVLGDLDLQLLTEGNHHQAYRRLGAHLVEHEGVAGTTFAVWAPNAQRVSIVGNFNGWDGRRHPMRVRGGSGVWELFVPGLGAGEVYKYQILTRAGQSVEKADPYAFASELRPKTASRIWDGTRFAWDDAAWLAARAETNWLRSPLNIYEVYLPAWERSPDNPDHYLNYRTLAHRLVEYVTRMAYTHVELLPVTEYPYDGSWGYQVTGYFAPTSRLGTPDDFKYFVNYCHAHGVGVIMDWVPAHFPKDTHGLARFDGVPLYEYADPRRGEHRDWGTYIFDYGRNEVRNFLLASALFWLDEYHIDGFRVDAVASILYLDYSRQPGDWLPNQYGGRENLEAIEFLRQLNDLTHRYYPGTLTVAEESTSFPGVTRPTHLGGLGFDFKWNMGWMNDTLRYIQLDPIHRKYNHNLLAFGLMYAFSEQFILPISHDEVVHLKRSLAGKMPGDHWQQMANVRLYLGFMFTHPGKKLLFMGQDIGQWSEFNELRSVEWHLLEAAPHQGVNRWLHDVLHLVRDEPALHAQDHDWQGFEWIDVHDWEQSIISYVRFARDRSDFVIVIHNFTPVVRYAYHLGVPAGGTYREVLNSDAVTYWGSGTGNDGRVRASAEPWGTFSHSLRLTLPPLATLILKPLGDVAEVDAAPPEGDTVAAPRAPAEQPGWVTNIREHGDASPPMIEAAPPAEQAEQAVRQPVGSPDASAPDTEEPGPFGGDTSPEATLVPAEGSTLGLVKVAGDAPPSPLPSVVRAQGARIASFPAPRPSAPPAATLVPDEGSTVGVVKIEEVATAATPMTEEVHDTPSSDAAPAPTTSGKRSRAKRPKGSPASGDAT